MEMTLYISFILASIILIIVPGPNVLVIVSTSVTHGIKRGLQTVLGTSSAMVLQLLITALGTTWFVESMATGFVWLKWFGVGYLLYLGVSHLLRFAYDTNDINPKISATNSFTRGFLVSLTNPKTILFFSAFLPQFVSNAALYLQQIITLSVTFLILATTLDSLYASVANRLHRYFEKKNMPVLQHGLSGVLFIGAGAWLALTRRG